jgi:GNAT superfamily N-acetyltransferase
MVLDEQGTLAARSGLWWQDTPALDNQRLGFVGHYFARDAAAARAVLALACRQLLDQSCTLAVGPVDGNTWQRYRLLTERGPEPLFLLEPDNPDDWPAQFLAAGFTPLAHYFSAVTTQLLETVPRLSRHARNLEAQGIHLRTLDARCFDEELRRIYSLSLEAFRDNFLYSPLREEDFLEQYRAVQPFVDPRLVILAEKDEELVGFFFTLPDVLEKQRGQPNRTVIAKTMAVHPDYRGAGLGGWLMGRVHEAAHLLGYTRVIHALMHESNHSRNLSAHGAQFFRRYTLYARPLKSS